MNNTKKAQQITPSRILDINRFLIEEESVKNSLLIQLIIPRIERDNISICDVGGASGILLQEITNRSSKKINGTVLDVIDYKAKLVNQKINFINASILNNDIPDNSFDIVTFRHILHHLVGDTVNKTLELQKQALYEMIRIIKNGGYLIFEEEVNKVKIFSRLVYYLSKMANRYNIHSRYFQAGICIVSFMTPFEIINALKKIDQPNRLEIKHLSYHPWPMSLRWKITLLMSRVGSLCMVIYKV